MPSRKLSVCATFQDTMPPARMPQFTSESPNNASSAATARSQAVGEAAAKTVAIDHRDGRLRKRREPLPAPLIGGVPRLCPCCRSVVLRAEIEPDVLSRAERLAGAGEHENLGLRIDCEIGKRVVHFDMQLRAHGVALFRPVHDQPGDAVLLLDQHGLVVLSGHPTLLFFVRRDKVGSSSSRDPTFSSAGKVLGLASARPTLPATGLASTRKLGQPRDCLNRFQRSAFTTSANEPLLAATA